MVESAVPVAPTTLKSYDLYKVLHRVIMQSERVTFFEQYTKNKDEPSPVQKWSRGGRFPLKLMACILVICMTSVQIYLLTTRTVDHSRQFTRALHYYVLDHTGFDFYWAGSYNFNYPIQEYFTLE